VLLCSLAAISSVTVATGLAGTLAASNVMGNDRSAIGIIDGAADARFCSKPRPRKRECVGAADVYTKATSTRSKPSASGAKTYLDHRRLLEDKDIDAVLIATPQHLHCQHFHRRSDLWQATSTRKRPWRSRRTMPSAMRSVYQNDAGKHVCRSGTSGPPPAAVADALAFNTAENMGKITMIHAHMYRTHARKGAVVATIYPDMTPEELLWKSFLGESRDLPFERQALPQLAVFWDLLRRQRLRKHVPPALVLVKVMILRSRNP